MVQRLRNEIESVKKQVWWGCSCMVDGRLQAWKEPAPGFGAGLEGNGSPCTEEGMAISVSLLEKVP